VVCFFWLLGLVVATQYFAHIYGYHSALGRNIDGVYAPWMILVWAAQWYGAYKESLIKAGSLGVLVSASGMLGLIVIQLIRRNSSSANQFLHGSARWGERKDIEEAGLFAEEGVYVGGWLDKRNRLHYLRHNGPEHILTFAPTRSGKGVGLVIPTLLSWKHSAVVTDLKGELWALSAGWRQRHAGNRVLRFEPATSKGCVGWNPLEEIRLGTEHEVGDVQNLATLIVDPDGKGLNDHWQKTSQALLVGCILHLCYRSLDEGGVASLPALDAMLADPLRPIGDLWQEMAYYGHLNGENHPLVGSSARDMLDRPVFLKSISIYGLMWLVIGIFEFLSVFSISFVGLSYGKICVDSLFDILILMVRYKFKVIL